jgi:hypothetical protein
MGSIRPASSIFVIVAIVFILVIVELYIHVFISHDYLILTTEEEIDTFKSETFGVFADYI